jgi:hypothetical protein
MAMADELAKSPYMYLFKDENFKRWYQNVKKRRSANTAYECFWRIGTIHRKFNVLPKDFVKMDEKKRSRIPYRHCSQLEAERKSGSYIANNVKPIKNWLSFNGTSINQRIEIARRNELVTVADEMVPIQKELARIFLPQDCLEQKPRQHW